MSYDLLLNIEIDILVLLLIACLSAIALKQLKFPYTIGLVIIGLILGTLANQIPALEVINTFKLSEELILFIFVPPLIFESALNMDSRLLVRNLAPVLVLAVPGLLISTAIVGTILAWLTPLSWWQALLFGSLISATDPVAVIALFKELGAPKQLTILVEGESLFNDATAIVAFNIILGVIATGEMGSNAIKQGMIAFFISFFGGIIIGAVFGYVMSWLLRLTQENSLVLFTITTVIAYGAFIIAEKIFAVSPVMAVVSAGLVIGWYKSNRLDKEVREYVGEFWEYAAFLANSFIFLLVGITAGNFRFFKQLLETQSLLTIFGIAIVTVLIARAIVIFTLVPIINHITKSQIPLNYQLVSYWGGLRGAVCLALALSIDAEFPNRDLIVILTLGIALFTLLVPGTTMGKLIKTLELNRPSTLDRLTQTLATFSAKQAAFDEIKKLQAEAYFLPEVSDRLLQKCQQELDIANRALSNFKQEHDLSTTELEQLVWLKAVEIEQQVYRELQDRGFISNTVLAQLTLMLNLKSDAVQAGKIPPQLTIVKPLEIRLGNALLKLLNNTPWAEYLQNNLIETEYEYLTFIVYGYEQVPLRLNNLIQDSSIPQDSISQCVAHYEEIKQLKLQEVKVINKKYPQIAILSQSQVLERVCLVRQSETLNKLVKQAAISQSTSSKIIQMMEIGSQ
ncbi:MAG: sodium:proton antiporter [Cyanobacteria bacterium J06621_8]